MYKVRLFLSLVIYEDAVETYIKNDRWLEFPTRRLSSVLEEYEAARKNRSILARFGFWLVSLSERSLK